MHPIDRMIRVHPKLRNVDYQRLAQSAKADRAASWPALVEASVPIVYTVARRLARGLREEVTLAEIATREVFEGLRAHDHARLEGYVGFGRWPSLLLRWCQESEVLASRRRRREFPPEEEGEVAALADVDQPIPELDPRLRQLCDAEGDRLLTALARTVQILHRRDRLLLAFRYEQGLTLRELDQLFRLGTPARVASLLARLVATLQPIQSILQAWEVPAGQDQALLRVLMHRLYRGSWMQAPGDGQLAVAMQQR